MYLERANRNIYYIDGIGIVVIILLYRYITRLCIWSLVKVVVAYVFNFFFTVQKTARRRCSAQLYYICRSFAYILRTERKCARVTRSVIQIYILYVHCIVYNNVHTQYTYIYYI